MKNLLSNNAANNNVNAFAKFQTASIEKSSLKTVKGGEDVIIQDTIDF